MAEATALFKKGDTDGASAKLRRILAEDPLQHEAQELLRQLQEKAAENNAVSGSPTIRKALKKTISLEFQDAGLKSVFSVISRVSGLNFVFDKDIKPELKTTILVKDMTIEDAVKLVLVTNQLQQEVINDNTIIIYPDTPAKIKDYQQQVVKSFYLANADVKKTLEMIKTILKAKDIFIDDRRNLLVMRDTPEVIRLAEKLIAAQDLPDPEVELEVEILEIDTTRLSQSGSAIPPADQCESGQCRNFYGQSMAEPRFQLPNLPYHRSGNRAEYEKDRYRHNPARQSAHPCKGPGKSQYPYRTAPAGPYHGIDSRSG